jgi:uncharacterized membrane protein
MDENEKKLDQWLFINDWSMKSYLTIELAFVSFIILFLMARAVFGDGSNTNPIGYFLVPFMIFLPGASLLRILRLHGLGFVRSILYSIALSILSIMVLGALLNIFHYANIMVDPLSFGVIGVAFPAMMLAFLIASYYRDSGYIAPKVERTLDISLVLCAAFAVLLPFVVIAGTHIADFYGSRTVLYITVLAICFIPLAVLSAKTKHYELLILSVSLALLWHRGLMTDYLQGYDMFSEYSAAHITTVNGWWNVFEYRGLFGGSANTSLSMVSFAPIITNITSIQTVELLKIVYPFIYAFVPLAIFKVIESQFGRKPAFLGTMLFMGYLAFFGLMIQLGKQQTAEIFLVCVLLVLTDVVLPRGRKRMLIYLFIIGLLVSHYAIAFIFIGMLVAVFALQTLKFLYQQWKERNESAPKPSFPSWIKNTTVSWLRNQLRKEIITLELLLFALLFIFIWYSTTASGMQLGYVSYGQLSTKATGSITLSQLDALEFLAIDYGSPLHNVEKYLVVISQAITIIGVAFMVKHKKTSHGNINDNFLFLGITASMVLVACYVVPNLSAMLYYGRFFEFTLIFLGGFYAIGMYSIVSRLAIIYRRGVRNDLKSKKILKQTTMIVSIIFLIMFIMANTGVGYSVSQEFVNEYSTSYSLDSRASWSIYSDSDVIGAKWASDTDHRDNYSIMADWHRIPIFAGQSAPVINMAYQMGLSYTDSLLYLSSWNVKSGYAYPLNVGGQTTISYTPLTNVTNQFGNYDIVYSTNSYTTVYYLPPAIPQTNTEPGPAFYHYDLNPSHVNLIYVMAALGASALVFGLASRMIERRANKK